MATGRENDLVSLAASYINETLLPQGLITFEMLTLNYNNPVAASMKGMMTF